MWETLREGYQQCMGEGISPWLWGLQWDMFTPQSEMPAGAVLRNARDEGARCGAISSSPPCGNNLTCAIAQCVPRHWSPAGSGNVNKWSSMCNKICMGQCLRQYLNPVLFSCRNRYLDINNITYSDVNNINPIVEMALRTPLCSPLTLFHMLIHDTEAYT